jgi:hypothetical protein
MKKLLFILLILIFASSASAAVYKWVDEAGVVNFTDDPSKIPPYYRNKTEEWSIVKTGSTTPSQTPPGKMTAGAQSRERATQAPPIAQALIREGDFAVKLAERLKIGQAKSEAEAESMLASAGIIPKNGWIGDYPVTPDIIGEVENAISAAVDSGKLKMAKNEAITALQDVAAQLGLPVTPNTESQYAEAEPPGGYGEYSNPEVINNYYYNEGPPVITYYPPPWDYYYMYAWIPSPFWYTGFYFPGFYVLCDFHVVIIVNKHAVVITNHVRDHRTGRIFVVDPARRHEGRSFGGRETPSVRGFNSAEARNGARSIFERSRERVAPGNPSTPAAGRGLNERNPAYSRSGRGTEKQINNRESNSPRINGPTGNYSRPPVTDRRMNKTPVETGSRGMSDRVFNRPDSMNRQSGMSGQRPSAGETRSFSPPSRGIERSFSPPSQGGGQHFNSSPTSPMSGRGSFSPQQGGQSGGGFGHGGPRF